ncbi:MAG: hypothetical protein COA43_00900 [Robiginitomaculum sp.]|nr:MAG: hypothetical protein COA43_00900 [Robiginitomaculum sp.]
MSFLEKLLEPVQGVMLPVPADLAAPELVALLFTVWAAAFGIAVFPWAIYRWLKKKDDIPLWMCVGGLLCSIIEPMLDHIGHLWYPTNLPGPAFTGFELNIPWLIPPCYVFFISMTGYWAYTRMKDGLDIKGLFLVWLLISMTDLILEMPGTAMGAYTYYGDASFKIFGFPIAWGWLNGTSMLAVGALLWLVEPHLRGKKRAYLALVSVSAMGASYGVTAWPYFMSLNWDGLPWISTRLLTVASLVLCLILVRFIAAAVAKNGNVSIKNRVGAG